MNIEEIVKKVVKEIMQGIEKNDVLFAKEKRDDLIIKYEDFIEDWKDIDFYHNGCKVDNYKVIIIPELSLNNLIDISFGRETDDITSLVVDGFLNGLDILIIEEGLKYRKFENKSNEEFYKYISSIEKRIEKFGVKFISMTDLKTELNSYRKYSNLEYKFEKKLISKVDVDELVKLGKTKVIVDKNTIITDLAKEYLVLNNIDIKKIK